MARTFPRLAEIGLWLAVVGMTAAGPALADPLSGLSRLFKDWGLFQGLQVNGSNEFTFQQNIVEGSTSAYQGQRWDTEPFIRRSSLSLEGPIWKEFSFKADLSASGYGTAYSRFVAGYVGHDTALYYGDLNIDLSGNQFASFSKAVQGWQLDEKIGKGLARVFYSKERAITRTQTIAGNNTSGPFFLTYTPVLEGTEVVKVNERRMSFGVDYRLDYSSGQLWFEVEGKAPTIIPDTSTISVSYQSAGAESQGSTLYGGRLLMPLLNDRVQLGVTMVKQDRGSGQSRYDTVGYQEDIFTGSGSTGPFDVNFRPIIANGTRVVYKGKEQIIQQALLVLVDSVEQAEGVDYDSYRSIGRIIFRRSVPPTSLVTIRYYYDLSSSTTSLTDNMVMGVDMMLHVSPQISLQAEWGHSDGGLTSNTGDALRANLSYTTPRFKVVGEYRDIAPTFSFLDSVGFYTQDRGYELGVSWEPVRHVSVAARHSDLKTAQGYTFGYSGYSSYSSYSTAAALGLAGTTDGETASLDVASQRDDLEVRMEFPGWPTFSFQRQELANSGSTSNSTYGSNTYNLNWSPRNLPVTLTATLGQTNQDYVPTSDSTAATGSSTRQLQWSAAYRPSDKLSFSYNRSRNNSTSTSSSTSRSSSASDQMAVHWSPSNSIDLNYDFTRTNSLGSVSSGLYTTYARSSAAAERAAWLALVGIQTADGEESETNRYTDNSHRLTVRYSPSQKLSFDFGLMMRKYTSGGSVGYLADSDQTTGSFNASYMLSNALSLSASYTNDRMKFLDEDRGTVLNNTISVGTNYRPTGSPWGFGLTFNVLAGSSPTYTGYGSSQKMRIVDNNMSDLQARISYQLSKEAEIGLTGQLSDYAGGYSNFNRQQLELSYRHRLSEFADLTFGYRFARNVNNGETDPRYGNTSLTPDSQNYLANTFLLTVSTQFNTGVAGRGSSLGTFGGGGGMSSFTGYRSGTNMSGLSTSSGYSTNFNSAFGSLGTFGSNSLGSSGYSNPFGTGTYGSYGSSGSYSSQPQGYDVFGSNFGSQGGFKQGLGDISGGKTGDTGTVGPRPPTAPGAPDGSALPIEDWQTLDDLYSIWW